uniref:Auxin-responsive protein n=1 Tax=Oryza glumipatula TaxID=40148 RepID=A0A0D9ZQF0_9ORYZ
MEQQHLNPGGGGGKKSNKITEIVRLQQMLKKWRKLSVAPKDAAATAGNGGGNGGAGESKAKKFLKRTLSFTDGGGASPAGTPPPRGHLAVCVGPTAQRFVIPTDYLKHRAFAALLREAEEEFGFQQEGVLRIPCEVPAFEAILKAVEKNKKDNAAAFCYCSYEYAADEVALGAPNNPLCR